MDAGSHPLVVFDLDGVLIDSAEANVQAFRYGLTEVGITIDEPRQILSLVGLPAVQMLSRLGCPTEAAATVFQKYVRPFYLENLPSLARAYPGATGVLEALKRSGFRIAACTSGDRITQTAALKAIGLWEYIEEMQTPDDSSYGKPDPRYLKELVDRFPKVERIHHVEDSEIGLIMGRDCGAITFFAAYGNGRLSEGIKPDFVINTIADLPMAILRAHATCD